MKKTLLCLITAGLFATTSHIELRHLEPEGIGFSKGYSTLQGFVTPNWYRKFQPFVDVRGHLFNDARPATNLGLGGRFLAGEKWIYGLNSYYDFRDAKYLRSHQLGVGLEALHPNIELRANGYIPTRTNASTTQFVGNTTTGRIKRHAAGALANVMVEMGFPMTMGPMDFFTSIGPYYLAKRRVGLKHCAGTYGGMLRARLRIYDGIDIGGNLSYDKEFKTRTNGYLTLSLPWWGSNTVTRRGTRGKQLDSPGILQSRMTQNVVRQEIIPICTREDSLTITQAQIENLIPDCIFVDSNAPAGGDGSFENPFNDINDGLAALDSGECLYLYDRGTDYIVTSGIFQIPQNVEIVGSGTDFTFGSIFFPAQTLNRPIVDGSFGVSPSSTIAGLHITSGGLFSGAGSFSNFSLMDSIFDSTTTIFLTASSLADGSSVLMHGNTFNGVNFFGTSGIFLISLLNTIIDSNTFIDTTLRPAAYDSLILQNNIMSHTAGQLVATSAAGDTVIRNNTATAVIEAFVFSGSSTMGDLTILNNTVTGGTRAVFIEGLQGTADIRNNIADTGDYAVQGENSITCIRIEGNTGTGVTVVAVNEIVDVDGDPPTDNPLSLPYTPIIVGTGVINLNTGCFP